MEMEYARAFTYPQQDPAWARKWALAGALSLIPVIGPLAVAGYRLEIARRVANNEPLPLPEWSDLAGHLGRGLGDLALRLIYLLPLMAAAACVGGPLVALSVQSNHDAVLDGLAAGLGVCLGVFAAGYGTFAAMMLEAALGEYAASGEVRAGLRFDRVLRRVRTRPGVYLAVALTNGLSTAALMGAGLAACLVGAAWAGAYAQLAHGHLVGQAHRFVQAGATPD